ncbi:hypothetical protein HN011_007541 [Eciton burchellii]|nr:hypothetical protein HN011_007541 [Eciton burchellii]
MLIGRCLATSVVLSYEYVRNNQYVIGDEGIFKRQEQLRFQLRITLVVRLYLREDVKKRRVDKNSYVQYFAHCHHRRLPDDESTDDGTTVEEAFAATMSFVEQPLFGREIVVPAKLPMILKQFCKAAIRTQPYDLLKWSGSYFRALAEGEELPVKSRLEYPPPSTASGLTLGFLRVLLRQFGNYNKTLPIETILHRWDCLCLGRKDLDSIVTIGRFRRVCQVKKFLAIAVGHLGGNLTETMIMICQLFTHEPDGGSAMIPLTLFMEMYEYLAELACDGKTTHDHGTLEHTAPKDASIDRQDTDVVNSNLELISKDEIDSSQKTDLSTDLIESISFENDIHHEEKGEESSISRGDASVSGDCANKDDRIDERSRDVTDANSDENTFSQRDANIIHYPNVPGIGPRVAVERVASVASWMLECAKLQEGMIGPRNIRHTNCPSLYE